MVRLSRLLNTQKVASWSLDSIKANFLTNWKFFYLIKIKIKHFISSQSNLWQEITAQRTNLKVCGVVVITSALQAESLQFKPGQHQGKLIDKMKFFFTWLKFRSSILFLVNPTFDRKLLLKVLILRSVVYWLSRLLYTQRVGSSSLDSIKASFWTKWRFFYLIKIKIKHFISSQSNIWHKLLLKD